VCAKLGEKFQKKKKVKQFRKKVPMKLFVYHFPFSIHLASPLGRGEGAGGRKGVDWRERIEIGEGLCICSMQHQTVNEGAWGWVGMGDKIGARRSLHVQTRPKSV